MKTWLVTGGAGFIGSCFVRMALADEAVSIVNLDKLTYAGSQEAIPSPPSDRYTFVRGCINDTATVRLLLHKYRPDAVIHFAAESHVDRSIDGPAPFLQTNVVGSVNLLEQTLSYYDSLSKAAQQRFRFLHVSTDEVFGSLGQEGRFCESSPLQPNSPYAASKAAADLFVRAFWKTYGLPTLTTNCSNNYGPYQHPEKLIPLMILNAAASEPLPVYGDGQNVRDWLYVEDHCRAIMRVLHAGTPGETYSIGADAELTNLALVHRICELVDERMERSGDGSSRDLIRFVADRPGHDRRYAIDAARMRGELGWRPLVSIDEGLRRTVDWYLTHPDWTQQRCESYVRQRFDSPGEEEPA